MPIRSPARRRVVPFKFEAKSQGGIQDCVHYIHDGYLDTQLEYCYSLYVMVTNKVTAKEARDNFTDVLGMAYYGKQPVIVERKGRPFAVVINPQEFEKYEKYKEAARKRILEIIEEIQGANKKRDYNEVLNDVTRAVEEIRSKRYAGKK